MMNKGAAVNIKVAVDNLLKDADTKRFLEGVCHFRKPTHGPGIEQKDGDVAEGRRQVYLTLLTISDHEPEDLVALYQEQGEQHV